MPYDELLKWQLYLERRPIDWRDDLRTYYLMKQQGYDKSPGQLFPSLDAIFKHQERMEDDVRKQRTLKGSALFSKLLGAKGGVKLEE